jgi:MarR family transcriptional regulator, 2-MHQ and catechol-resistance regulon repressor
MKKDAPTPVHAWLVMMKATQAISRYALADLEESGLGLSDFAVLEVLLHKGPLPVNVIGPKVNLTPGSISVAVDRLVAKGLVSRVECSEDRRIRIVALTPRGKSVIAPIFRAHAATMEKVFAGLSADELQQLEAQLKRIGRQAESLFEQRIAKRRSEKMRG